MAMTKERRSELVNYLSASRNETMTANLTYGDEERSFLALADMETVERAPVDGFGYKCYVFTAKNRTAHCPVHINIHGGGFFYGHKENDHMFSAWLSDKIKGVVVDLDYSTTADGAAWPVPMDQCYDAAKWVFSKCGEWDCDAKRVSMGGYSAGSTLTCAAALKAAETGEFRLCLQVLGYGVVDSATSAQFKLPGYGKRMMPAARMDAFSELLTDGDPNVGCDKFLSPCFAPDELVAASPRTLIITAGECDLRHEDERYGAKLASLGVEVTMRRVLGAKHGFIPHFMAHWREGAELVARAINSASL